MTGGVSRWKFLGRLVSALTGKASRDSRGERPEPTPGPTPDEIDAIRERQRRRGERLRELIPELNRELANVAVWNRIGYGFTDITFLPDGTRGWAVGYTGEIFASTDGGETWTRCEVRTGSPLNSIHFTPDGTRGWVAGDYSEILATTDGGETWFTQHDAGSDEEGAKRAMELGYGNDHVYYRIQFTPDGSRGWAMGEPNWDSPDFGPPGMFLVTSDGGQSWAARDSGLGASSYAAHFLEDGLRGWAVGTGIVATIDGGYSWTDLNIGLTGQNRPGFFSVQFMPDGLRGWVAGEDGVILVTADGGKIWTAQSSGTNERLNAVHFGPDGAHGWAVGHNGTILATTDGGRRWIARTSGIVADLQAVHFLPDGLRGWTVGNHGAFLATTDGGATWVGHAGLASVRSSFFLNDGRIGWAIDASLIFFTADRGRSWTVRNRDTYRYLQAVQFSPDGMRGWTIGWEGTILTTSDGGANWNARKSGGGKDLNSVHFLPDGARGWAVGELGAIVATADGGETWTARDSGMEARLDGIYFLADGMRGWAFAGIRTILATTDGGETWNPKARFDNMRLPRDLDVVEDKREFTASEGFFNGYRPLLPDMTTLGASVETSAVAAYQALRQYGEIDREGLETLEEILTGAVTDNEALARKSREGDDTS